MDRLIIYYIRPAALGWALWRRHPGGRREVVADGIPDLAHAIRLIPACRRGERRRPAAYRSTHGQ
jgi:hypothetical protein